MALTSPYPTSYHCGIEHQSVFADFTRERANLCQGSPEQLCCGDDGYAVTFGREGLCAISSSFVVRRSSFVVRRSSFVVRRSSFVVRWPMADADHAKAWWRAKWPRQQSHLAPGDC